MTTQEEISNIFNSDGKLLQIEYGLEAVNNALPVVTVKSKSMIVCASKKAPRDKLEESDSTSFYKVSEKCYVAITGLPGDIDYVVKRIKMVANRKTFSFGTEVTPDILCRSFADKIQKLIQSSEERSAAFNASIFGFDGEKATIYQTDMSGISYPCYGTAAGERHGKMTKFIEKSYRRDIEDKELFEIAIGALLESIGADTGCSEIEVGYLRAGKDLCYLSAKEIDKILQDIAEK
ncbi:20S proteasome subunit alpha [Encephalitozoon hellem ATCC 50504]|uniref:Proteasome subunit alpha type-1 n=1 Tax=Encephalitozoon hellem TaxID=27973 RepID=A0A9Q9CDX2_ENCHE|nr:20S proteasome subunit alpha [Encephalitozoon hellem ATCC 50504]AFM99148.1 20S proteasome subunit alpha [Encephalitozoon hellem ATCC 50504]UTX44134.1 proteasome subunit alpha type-1 [Encephalitozoon hellem]WEL39623.1 proteasome subunit alpha type-7 [Encephalitozoon hellem]|eukprot:XP_003888129.1 20S proteasome subunit alpha [Encephalitozoon hellem ATCC 50504]